MIKFSLFYGNDPKNYVKKYKLFYNDKIIYIAYSKSEIMGIFWAGIINTFHSVEFK